MMLVPSGDQTGALFSALCVNRSVGSSRQIDDPQVAVGASVVTMVGDPAFIR